MIKACAYDPDSEDYKLMQVSRTSSPMVALPELLAPKLLQWVVLPTRST